MNAVSPPESVPANEMSGTIHVLQRVQEIPRALHEVFGFFADAGNLQVLTPPFLHFRILTPLPIAMQEGTLIDYRLRLYSVPIRWKTRIESWEPNRRFVDRQLRGPYRLWHHTHTFEPIDGGTRMTDLVRYQIPFGPLGAIARRLFVTRSLDQIFDFRRDTIARLFGSFDSALSAGPPLAVP